MNPDEIRIAQLEAELERLRSDARKMADALDNIRRHVRHECERAVVAQAYLDYERLA